MTNPFIPINKANIAIIDGRASEDIVNNLEKLNIKVIRTIKCKDLQESVSYHPDIIMHPINHNTIIVTPIVFDYYDEQLSSLGINVVKGETILRSKYPYDIAYNVGRLNNIAIHNFKYTDEKLKFYLKKENLEFININQGYSKCSLAIVDDISGITADLIMFKRLSVMGLNMLLIRPGFIELENEDYGFIGGATGNYSNRDIFFTGKLNNHPDFEKIENFIKDRNMKIIYLSKNEVIDLGTIITLNNC